MSKLALKSLTKENMEAAGIEIKMTRAEMAEYIATKMKKELQKEIAALGKDLPYHIEIEVQAADFSPRITTILQSILAGFPGCKMAIHVNRPNDWAKLDAPHHVNVSFHEGKDHKANFVCNLESAEMPEAAREFHRKWARVFALQQKLENLDKKKYRITLLEQNLKSSVAGKKVIASVEAITSSIISDIEG
jgi:hypothetical protein